MPSHVGVSVADLNHMYMYIRHHEILIDTHEFSKSSTHTTVCWLHAGSTCNN